MAVIFVRPQMSNQSKTASKRDFCSFQSLPVTSSAVMYIGRIITSSLHFLGSWQRLKIQQAVGGNEFGYLQFT